MGCKTTWNGSLIFVMSLNFMLFCCNDNKLISTYQWMQSIAANLVADQLQNCLQGTHLWYFKLNIKWWDPAINSLAPGRCGCNLNWIIFKLFSDRYLEHFLWNCPQVNATRPHWWLVNIGAGNGSGAIRHQAITWAILCMCPANGRWRYNVTSSLIGWVHTQNYPCIHCPLWWAIVNFFVTISEKNNHVMKKFDCKAEFSCDNVQGLWIKG